MELPPIKWTASPNFSSRGGVSVTMIVVHDCEGSYAGSISWFAMTKSQVSAHLVLREDGLEATQMVKWTDKAWHACSANPMSEGIEAAGFAAKGLGNDEMLALANLVAWRLHANKLPCTEATQANGWKGFTEHARLGAWGGSHHDFTESASVWNGFVAMVQKAYLAGQAVEIPGSIIVPPPAAPADYLPNTRPRIDAVDASAVAMKSAIQAFQSASGLEADGDPGPQTRTAYLKAIGA